MNPKEYFYRRNLPHYQPPGATFFVTFRLEGSLPKHVVERLRNERDHEIQISENILVEHERHRTIYRIRKKYFGKFDYLLDLNETGPSWLGNPHIAQLVADAIHYRDGHKYRLICHCIMPNHVHMVVTDLKCPQKDEKYHLTRILQHLKRYTSTRANRILKRTGQKFWHDESYDHVVRNHTELLNIIKYVLNNPVRAKLRDEMRKRPWVYSIY